MSVIVFMLLQIVEVYNGGKQIEYTVYIYHQSILAIHNNCKNGIKLAFEEIDLASIGKEIHNLKLNKPSQSSDFSTKIVKENTDIFAEFLWKSISSSIKSSTFPSSLKLGRCDTLTQKRKKRQKR